MRIKHALSRLSSALAALESNNNSDVEFDAALKAATSLSEKMDKLTPYNRNLYLRSCEKLANHYALDNKYPDKAHQLNELYLKGNIGQLDKLAKAQVDLLIKLTLENYVNLPNFDAHHVNLYQEKISGLDHDLEFLKNFQIHFSVEQQKIYQNILWQTANYYEFKTSQLQSQADTHKTKSEKLRSQLVNSVARSEMKRKRRTDVVSAHTNNPQSLFYTGGGSKEESWADFLALESEMDAELDAQIEAEMEAKIEAEKAANEAQIEAYLKGDDIEDLVEEPLPDINESRPAKRRKVM